MKKMKFLLGALSFMAAAFMASPSQAQVKTYLSENFSDTLNPSVWNVDACTKISDNEGILIYLRDPDGNNISGWVYDPKGAVIQGGGFNDTIDGTYELIANPIQLEENTINVIIVPYLWQASRVSPLKTFGVRVREENNTQWDTVNILELKSNSAENTFSAILDPKWNGKKVEIELFFNAKHSANSAFYFLMKEIKFSAFSDEPIVVTELYSKPAPVAYANSNFNVPVFITNTGAAPVSTIEYTYMIDNEIQETAPVNFDPALESFSGTAAGWLPVGMKDISIGNHLFKMFTTKINGKKIEATDTIELTFHTPDETQLTQQYVPLFEGFTSSTCGPCATANSYFNPALAELQSAGAINVIKYQMNFPGSGDPYYITGNQNRMRFYDGIFGWGGYWGVPSPIYNGMENITEWSRYWGDMITQLKSSATNDHKKKATIAIDITKANIDDTHKIDLELEITPSFDIKGKVYAVVVEKTTTGNKGSNGETEFHNVAMKFATSASGVEKTFEAGKKETLSFTVDMNNTKAESFYDLEVVCFVQHESGYIFQSSSILKSGNLPNEGEVMGDVRVYPNPASEFVNITNLDGADVEIFDLTGRRVYANSKVEGSLEIALASFANGTYVVRLTKDGQSAHRKLIVVR